VAPVHIATQRLPGGRRQGQTARLAKRGMAQGEQAIATIDVVVLQRHQCTDPHPGHREPPPGGRVGMGAQSRGGGQVVGGRQPPGDRGRALEIRGATWMAVRQHLWRWDLGTGIKGAVVRRQAPHQAEASGPLGGLDVRR
jgi:hypothetical protein